MAYQKFTEQSLAKLPVIIAGPILRRVDAYSVTVWVALKESRAVTLTVLDAKTGQEALPTATACASKIGKHLYLVCVTAQSTQHRLTRGKVYKYNLHFDGGQDLKSNGIYSTDNTGARGLCYADYDLPTFVILPERWQDLHFLHGSCRKIHGQGLDALPAADLAIRKDANNPNLRPQCLFMTGDQIYADDVSDGVLFLLQEIGNVLLGRMDTLPGLSIGLGPGRRAGVVFDNLFLTPERDVANNHLFYFYKFCAMYLLAWSDVLWPKTWLDFPLYKDMFGVIGKQRELSKAGEVRWREIDFLKTLPDVRRVLANIPCYMILDDHEVTDDWYLSADWCAQVLGNDAGRRVIQNGLAAYAIFQAWGNTPEQFDKPATPGHNLLQALQNSAYPASLTDVELLAHCSFRLAGFAAQHSPERQHFCLHAERTYALLSAGRTRR